MAEDKKKKYVSDNAQLMEEWDWEKNSLLGISPDAITLGSNRIVWWKCNHGHQWEMRTTQRTRGQGCPYCSNRRVLPGYNDLMSTHPEIAAEWDYDNNILNLQNITYGSNEIVWWKCSLGHRYQMAVHKKVSRKGTCPVCSGHKTIPGINDFETFYPDIAKEWHPTKNGNLKPSEVSRKNGRRIWWKCQYGHEWQATVRDRVIDKTGCPFCSARRLTSFSEQAIFYYIKKLYPDAINRYKEEFDNGMELDIYVPSIRLGIEFDGAAWHNNEDAHRREREKYVICKKRDIDLIRVKEKTGDNWFDVADTVYIIQKKRNRNELSVVIKAILDSVDPESNMWTRKNPCHLHSNIIVDLERDENEIREFLTMIPNSLEKLRPDLAKEWHPTRNGKLLPGMFGINSNDYAWWKCSICGHEWRTTIIHRGGKCNSGCPECSKKTRGKTFTKAKVKENGSLADNNPLLAAEWHLLKNENLTPTDITAKSNKKVWWLCPRCNHEWEATPNNRVKGSGCPCCSGRVPKIGENDFETLFPILAEEWDFEKNAPHKPNEFLSKSGRRVWWKCKTCGHEWVTEIRNRTEGQGCPSCTKKKRTYSNSLDKESDE